MSRRYSDHTSSDSTSVFDQSNCMEQFLSFPSLSQTASSINTCITNSSGSHDDRSYGDSSDLYDDFDFLSLMEEPATTSTSTTSSGGPTANKSASKRVSDRQYRLKKKEYVCMLEGSFVKRARATSRTWELIVSRMGTGASILPAVVEDMLTRIITYVHSMKYRTTAFSSSITAELSRLQEMLPSSISRTLSMKLVGQGCHDDVDDGAGGALEASASPSTETATADELSSVDVTKMKNRENARKTRLKKKLYTAALEESLRNLGRVLRQLRDLILSSGVETGVPQYLEEALATSESLYSTDDSGRSNSLSSSSISSATMRPSAWGGAMSDAPSSPSLPSPVHVHGPPAGVGLVVPPHQPGFIVINPHLLDDPIILCDPAFERRTGYSMREVLGRNISCLMKPPSGEMDEATKALLASMFQILRGGGCGNCRFKCYCKDGSPFWGSFNFTGLHDQSGALLLINGEMTREEILHI